MTIHNPLFCLGLWAASVVVIWHLLLLVRIAYRNTIRARRSAAARPYEMTVRDRAWGMIRARGTIDITYHTRAGDMVVERWIDGIAGADEVIVILGAERHRWIAYLRGENPSPLTDYPAVAARALPSRTTPSIGSAPAA